MASSRQVNKTASLNIAGVTLKLFIKDFLNVFSEKRNRAAETESFRYKAV
jgi:hypothetical protein